MSQSSFSFELILQFFMVWQAAEKVVFLRLLKNGQMQGTRNPEE